MGHTLILDLPEAAYEPLRRKAEEAGQSPEEFAAQWVARELGQTPEDPLEKFIGAFSSGVSDLGQRHDYYIGHHLEAEMRDEEP